MRAFSSSQTFAGSTIRLGEELRQFIRFRVFNASVAIKDQKYDLFDLSLGGMSFISPHNFIAGENLEGLLSYKGQTHVVELKVCRVKPNLIGVQFIKEYEFLKNILDAELYKKENFRIFISKENRNQLMYRNKTQNIFLGFKYADDKIQEFLLSFENVFVLWKEGHGSQTGIILHETKPEIAWGEESSLKVDYIVDKNKITLFKDIVWSNKQINSSLKDWILETLDLLLV